MSRGRQQQTTLDLARDELFSHIQRCGVLDAEDTERQEWMSDTVEYLRERYPALSVGETVELQAIGHRYCQPAIPFGVSDGDTPEAAVPEGESPEVAASEEEVPQVVAVSEGEVPQVVAASEGQVPQVVAVSEGEVPQTTD
ncbi:MAG: hypothetical protein N2B05_08945 [Gemmatimonadales bacterium]